MRTHDELLAKIDEEYSYSANALRSVVELHQPTPEGRYPDLLCQGCSMTEVNLYANYPCPTIQAIEKKLR